MTEIRFPQNFCVATRCPVLLTFYLICSSPTDPSSDDSSAHSWISAPQIARADKPHFFWASAISCYLQLVMRYVCWSVNTPSLQAWQPPFAALGEPPPPPPPRYFRLITHCSLFLPSSLLLLFPHCCLSPCSINHLPAACEQNNSSGDIRPDFHMVPTTLQLLRNIFFPAGDFISIHNESATWQKSALSSTCQ